MKRIVIMDDTTYNEEDSMSEKDILSHISFEKYKTIRAFAKCSYTLFDNNSHDGLTIHTPDTILYCDNKWSTVSRAKRTSIPLKKLSFEITGEHKLILGYICDKFLVKDIEAGETYFIWASKALPKTLNPVTGLTGFKYGILEATQINDSWSVLATKITKLK